MPAQAHTLQATGNRVLGGISLSCVNCPDPGEFNDGQPVTEWHDEDGTVYLDVPPRGDALAALTAFLQRHGTPAAAQAPAGHVRIETGKPAVATPGGPGVTSAKATYGRYRQAMYERGVIVCDWDGLTAEDRESWDAALADAIATPQPAPGLAAPVTVEGVLCRDYPAVVEAMQAALDRRKAVLLKVIGERDKLGRALENVFAVLDRQTRTYAERISYARTLIRTALEGK